MPFHICPTEIAAIMLAWDTIKIYTFHYKHLFWSIMGKVRKHKCKVCDE